VDAGQSLRLVAAQRVRDSGAQVAALCDVARVPEAAHQRSPCVRDAAGIPAELGRLAGQPVARQRREDEIERVCGGSAVGRRVGERTDGLEQLDHRAGPAVRQDQR
jgi:hypothetical protein